MAGESPKVFKALLLIVALAIVVFALKINQKDSAPQSPNFSIIHQFTKPKQQDSLQSLFIESTKTLPERYGIYIKNLKSGKTYELGAKESFRSASLYKLAVMYKAYDALDKGQIQKDEVLSEEVANPAEIQGGDENSPVYLTIEGALYSAITISENYSAILLAEKLGWENIHSYLKNQNIQGINLLTDEPTVTAYAIAELLEKIYRNQAVNRVSSEQMRKLLFAQKINDRIPKYLPDDIKVGHKTGELDFLRHDAGIVLGKKSDYIFVFLSQTDYPQDASENIAQLSKTFFDSLEK